MHFKNQTWLIDLFICWLNFNFQCSSDEPIIVQGFIQSSYTFNEADGQAQVDIEGPSGVTLTVAGGICLAVCVVAWELCVLCLAALAGCYTHDIIWRFANPVCNAHNHAITHLKAVPQCLDIIKPQCTCGRYTCIVQKSWCWVRNHVTNTINLKPTVYYQTHTSFYDISILLAM